MNDSSPALPGWSIGLMTGTVLDGNIDVALIRTDGERVAEFGVYRLIPYDQHLLSLLQETLSQARRWQFKGSVPDIFAEAEQQLSKAQACAVKQVLQLAGLEAADIRAVGFHGQTVLHRAPTDQLQGQTCQLGDGQLMANLLGIPVVYDFRSEDMTYGGQGAPLAAVYHRALLRDIPQCERSAVLNLGGIANLSWWDGNDTLIAFDTGPANAPLNDFVKLRGLGNIDHNGELAARGQIDKSLLQQQLTHSYLSMPYPKSLDRFDFTADMAKGLSDTNGAAQLTAFSAAAVGCGLDLLPQRPERLIVCGGGRHNPTMLAALETHAGVSTDTAEAVGWRGDAIEAECFAFLAIRVLRQLPCSFPSTTGASQPVCGGKIARPQI